MLNKKADAGFGVKELVLWIIVIVICIVILMDRDRYDSGATGGRK